MVPFNPNKILDKLPKFASSTLNRPDIPPNKANLDLSLLDNFPTGGTELREANKLLVSALDEVPGLSDPIRRYTARLATMAESTHAELLTARKELKSAKEVLNTRKKRTKGKSVALEGKFVFSTQEVLDIARAAEAEAEAKKKRKRPPTIDEILDEEEAEILEN